MKYAGQSILLEERGWRGAGDFGNGYSCGDLKCIVRIYFIFLLYYLKLNDIIKIIQ